MAMVVQELANVEEVHMSNVKGPLSVNKYCMFTQIL